MIAAVLEHEDLFREEVRVDGRVLKHRAFTQEMGVCVPRVAYYLRGPIFFLILTSGFGA